MKGYMKRIDEFNEEDLSAMFGLMNEFYDNMDENVFRKDFFEKNYCLVLYDEESGKIVGFSTQKLMSVKVGNKEINGVFSGDTIIHKEYWGDTELFKVWARFWFPYAEKYDEFYWFLICKGYKTYRILPTFWQSFYPNCRSETPEYEKNIIDAYAAKLYPNEYNVETGVIEYQKVKDKLKDGVADVDEHRIKNKDIAFFCHANPNYFAGNDLACLARINIKDLKKRVPALLFS